MNHARNKGVRPSRRALSAALGLSLLFPLLAAGCGRGEERKQFELYDKAVDSILAEEHDVLARYQEVIADVQAGFDAGSEKEVYGRLAPFYEQMAAKVRAVVPGNEKLRKIHEVLLHYVDLQQQVMELYGKLLDQAAGPQQRMKEADETLEKAQQGVNSASVALANAAKAVPDSLNWLRPLLAKDAEVSDQLGQIAEVLAQHQPVRAEAVRSILKEQLKDHYSRLLAEAGKLDLSDAEKPVAARFEDYVASMQKLMAAILTATDAQEEMVGGLSAIGEQVKRLSTEAAQARKDYLKDAQSYRDSLR